VKFKLGIKRGASNRDIELRCRAVCAALWRLADGG